MHTWLTAANVNRCLYAFKSGGIASLQHGELSVHFLSFSYTREGEERRGTLLTHRILV